MNLFEIYFIIVLLAVVVVTAIFTILIYRHFFEEPRYQAWAQENGNKVADLELKATALKLKLDTFQGQLLALGIKLPGATK